MNLFQKVIQISVQIFFSCLMVALGLGPIAAVVKLLQVLAGWIGVAG